MVYKWQVFGVTFRQTIGLLNKKRIKSGVWASKLRGGIEELDILLSLLMA